MIIDVHTHVWADQLDRLPEFLRGLDDAGVGWANVLPIAPHVSNEDVARFRDQAPDRIIGWASVHPFSETTGIPRTDPVDQLADARDRLGLRGLKLHPLIQGFSIADPGIVPVVRAAAELAMPVLLHTGPSNGRAGRMRHGDVTLIDDLAIMCPDTVIIVGHANPIQPEATYVARKHPNVYLEPSMGWPRYAQAIAGLTRLAIDHAGADKILFGSDYSIGKADRIRDIQGLFADLSDDEIAAISHKNFERVIGIPPL